jgi:DNA-binding transcriptional LysR family regulator
MLSLGHETLAPYARAGSDGRPLWSLPAPAGARVPFLSYGAGAYLGRLVELIAKQASQPLGLEPIYETDMAEGLKAMALEGHGLAFLPASSVKKEVKARRLVRAAAPQTCEVAMEVRIYRERPEVARRVKPAAQALWEFLSRAAPR